MKRWKVVDLGGDINEPERYELGVEEIGAVMFFGSREIADYVCDALNRFEIYLSTEKKK